MKSFSSLFLVAVILSIVISCKQDRQKIGDITWPLDARQNLNRNPPCDTSSLKTLSFEISHESSIDTSLYDLVIYTGWAIYNGTFKRNIIIEVPHCETGERLHPIICYLIEKSTPLSYQYQAKSAFNIFKSSLEKITIKLYSQEIEDSGSNLKVSIDGREWIY